MSSSSRGPSTTAGSALESQEAELREAADNVVIAYGMGWDMDGVIEALRRVLANHPTPGGKDE